MDIEKKEPPSLADSARRIVNSIAGIAETSVKTAKLAKQLKLELDKKDRIISQQSEEIEHLKSEREKMRSLRDFAVNKANEYIDEIERLKKLIPQPKRKCMACNGSGRYDAKGSPPCSACDGTGEVE